MLWRNCRLHDKPTVFRQQQKQIASKKPDKIGQTTKRSLSTRSKAIEAPSLQILSSVSCNSSGPLKFKSKWQAQSLELSTHRPNNRKTDRPTDGLSADIVDVEAERWIW